MKSLIVAFAASLLATAAIAQEEAPGPAPEITAPEITAPEIAAPEAPLLEPPAVHAMSLAEGKLTGPGAELILARVPDAQFILVGEEHGFADAPQIAMALARAGRKHGFAHHVVETGPLSEEWAGSILKKNGVEGLGQALKGRPLALPFLVMREDAELAHHFIANAPRKVEALWGVDQEFIGSALIHFETLERLAPNDEARALAASLLASEREAFASGEQEVLFLFTAAPDTFAKLRKAFGKVEAAGPIIDALEESAAVYTAFNTGRNFASNTDRVALIRRQFLDAYRKTEGKAPRAVFKMGAIHLGRGTTFLNTFDLGSLTDGIAAANGLDVLRVAYWPLAGRVTQITPFSESAFRTTDYEAEKEIIDGFAQIGLTPESIAEEGFTVVPLEPVRLSLEQTGLAELSPQMRFLVLGYDFLVTTRGARPATPLVP